jgi:hypothetical protein
MTWHHLQYAAGLARLGHDGMFLEDSDYYASCYDPEGNFYGTDPTYGLKFAADAFDRVGVGRWAYYDEHTNRWLGPSASGAVEFCRTADVLVNVSGVNPLRAWTEKIPLRILIDTDPAFTQVRHLTDEKARTAAAKHNSFFTFAENIASGMATVPDDGFAWRATRQPVLLDEWKVRAPPRGAPYTTVMQWRSYRPLEYKGRWFRPKAASFAPYVDFPKRTTIPLEIALSSKEEIKQTLAANGWRIVEAISVSRSPWSYQDYLAGSRGEVAVAKHGYVSTRSGWFSERSAGYLASGRPVITQETGFSKILPTGTGLLSFRNPDQLLDCIEQVEADYETHSKRAREIAEEYFDSSKILSRLLEEANSNW